MAYEHKEGQGSLFKNEKANDRQPDFKGTIVIGGVTYEVAAWERTSQKGMQYISLQASLPRERAEQQPQQGQQGQYGQSQPQQPQQPVSRPSVEPVAPANDFGFSDPDEDLPF